MKTRIVLALVILFSLSITNVFSQENSGLRKKEFNVTANGLALDGYDPVSYFVANKAEKGRKEFSTAFQGITYLFSSASNREEFKRNPAKYEPQFGGWCAYAMGAKGEKVEVDPETFKLLNGKLYLFYNKYFNNTLTTWNKDETNLRQKADQNWSRFFH